MASASPSSEEQQRQEQQVKDCVHRTKLIQFLGRTTPIVLQNDNGPCPLLAICNVLLLRNNLNLSPDTVEVSQEKLLALVAERLIDSNSNLNNKDAGYVENQQQNISDAIDLLPRLATGIDVNIKFRRMDDFEFTPECAIFDLLDIPLYHGWIVDPQDTGTANAIGSKSYNALTGELVALETQNMEGLSESNPEEDCVDFVAATTATLGVPSPCLSKTTSFDDSPHSLPDHQKARKGDLEEEAELLRALELSQAAKPTSVGDTLVDNINGGTDSVISYGSVDVLPVDSVDSLERHIGVEDNNLPKLEQSILDDCNAKSNGSDLISAKNNTGKEAATSFLKTDVGNYLDQSTYVESEERSLHIDVAEISGVDTLLQSGSAPSLSPGRETASLENSDIGISRGGEEVKQSSFTTHVLEPADKLGDCSTKELSYLSSPNANSDLSRGRIQHIDAAQPLTSSVDGSEPIYEGEECILDSRNTVLEEREPVYEGEVVLAKQADKSTVDAHSSRSKDEITPQEGELIRNFLKNNASQLTINGLFCLRDGLKESVLCVFFRNNHFSTMFKFHGELYLLATDQGYINQPDLVWEKLNEVNGDTLFMTGNFKEFRAESRANDTLDGNSRNSQQSGSSDLQLAIALQQKESEQQPQRRNSQRSGSSDLQLAIALQQEESEQQPQRRNSRQSGCSDLQLAIALQQQESEQQPRRRNSQQSGSSDLQLAIALQQEESEQQPHRRNSQQSGNSDLQLAIALQQEESEQQPQRRNSQQSGCSDLQLAIALQQQESEQQPRRRNSQQSGSSDLQLAIALQQEESEQQPRRRNSQQSGSSDLQLAIALQQLESEQQPRRRNSQQSGSFDLQLAIALQQQESEQQPHRPSS